MRSALARYIPTHFEDPLGLARRLLRSGGPEARYAMASAAAGTLLAPLDLLLERGEQLRLARARSARLPILLVMGPSRGGTTLVALSLIRSLPVSYWNNLAALFPRAPITANRVFGRQLRPAEVSLANYYGRTRGAAGPNDGLHLWDRWLGGDRARSPESVKPEEGTAMARFFGAWEEAFGGPLVAKNNSLIGCASLVSEWLPTARFVCLRREPLWLAQSLLEARRLIHGVDARSYGIDDPSRPSGLDPVEDVARQVRFLEALAERQRAALGPRFVDLSYEAFCADPVGVVTRLAREVLDVPSDPDAVRRALPPLHASRRRTLAPAEFTRLERAIANAGAGAS